MYEWLPATLNVPLPPVMVPAEDVPSPQLIVAEYAAGVAPVFGSVIVATVPPTVEPAGPLNEKPPLGTVSTIWVWKENVAELPAPSETGHSIPIPLSNAVPLQLSHVLAKALPSMSAQSPPTPGVPICLCSQL